MKHSLIAFAALAALSNFAAAQSSVTIYGKVDLGALMSALAARGVTELHVEAGHKLNASLLREDLVDELLVYLAPKLIGLGREMAAFGPLETLAEAMDFRFLDFALVGDDLRLRARPPGRETF